MNPYPSPLCQPQNFPTAQLGGTNAVSTPQVCNWMANLQEVVGQNQGLVRELNERLAVILRTEPSVPTNSKSEPEEYLVPLADGLRAAVRIIDANNDGLRDLLRRTEL